MTLRIGIDARPALVNREGIGRYVRELIHALARTARPERPARPARPAQIGGGHELHLFGDTLRASPWSASTFGVDGERVRLHRKRFPARLTPIVLRATRRGVDDAVGGCELYHHTSYSRLPVRAAREVATVHDCVYLTDAGFVSDETAERMAHAARELVRHASIVTVPSQSTRRDVVRLLGADESRVHVTPLGCDHVDRFDAHLDESAQPAPERTDEPFLLSVSRVDRRKNLVRMLRAFEDLVREGFPHRWIVVGPPGHGHEDFEEALASSPSRARVTWRRFVSDAELARLYQQAELFLFVSLAEGFGIPALEAMATGLPVVAGATTAMPEVCGDAASLVDPRDPAAIFDDVRELLRDPELRAERSRAGRARAETFTWERTAELTLDAYRAALADA